MQKNFRLRIVKRCILGYRCQLPPEGPPNGTWTCNSFGGGQGVLEHVLKDRSPLVLQGGGYVPVSQMGNGE